MNEQISTPFSFQTSLWVTKNRRDCEISYQRVVVRGKTIVVALVMNYIQVAENIVKKKKLLTEFIIYV